MNETSDDARLQAEEAQMRHALGLSGEAQVPRPQEQSGQSGLSTDRLSLHRPPRRFVKDGEVPVTVVRRTHPVESVANITPTASNQLEAARQTIRSQAAATERAERLLNEAQATIRDLRTKLAHERMAKEEAFQTVHRLESERDTALSSVQTMRTEVATERVGREKTEQELRKLLDAKKAAADAALLPRRPRGRPRKIAVEGTEPAASPKKRGRPRKIVVEATEPPALPKKRGRPRKIVVEGAESSAPPKKRGRPRKVITEPAAPPRPRGRPRKVPVSDQVELGLTHEQPARRLGRPPKLREPKPVKWWAKGWKATAV